MVVVIAVLLALNSNPQHDNAGPALVSPSPTAVASTSAAPTTPAPTPTTGTPATHVEAKRTRRPVAPVIPVSVLNNSTRTGLAHRAAAQVSAEGWPIAKIGNFTGRVAMSTLYYAPGELASAQRLARAMPAIRRVLPRFAGLPTTGLTLVVTREWPA
ncbi:MAG TPA: LytR C-terminal domain-containing protein [Mycobacteriales bacterium]|nr:LytR C-terminal domain-containing protein [Mycobacteriales bacterium]